MATLVRLMDSIFSMAAFSAILCSILLVTSCSIFSALVPGHTQVATATRTGMKGSLALGSRM